MKQIVKRRNHEVPRGLLKNWTAKRGDDRGLYYLNVPVDDGRVMFERGASANFAITDFLYVPLVNLTDRDDSLEDWFAVDENGLAPFAKAAQNADFSNFRSEKLMVQAVRACIALGFRSAYQFFSVGRMLESYRTRAETTIHQAMIDNSRRIFALKFKQFSNWDFSVLCNLPGTLMLNEQPFRDWTFRGINMVTMPLGPNALLVGMPPNDPIRREMQIDVRFTPDRFALVDMQNNFAIVTARQWLVSTDKGQLKNATTSLTSSSVDARVRLDRQVILRADGSVVR